MPVFVAFDWFDAAGGGDAGSFTTDPTAPASGGTGGLPPGLIDPGIPPPPPPIPGPVQPPAEEWCACCPGACCLPVPGLGQLCVRVDTDGTKYTPDASALDTLSERTGWHQIHSNSDSASPGGSLFWARTSTVGGRQVCVRVSMAFGADCTPDGRIALTVYYMAHHQGVLCDGDCTVVSFELPPEDYIPFLSSPAVSKRIMFWPCMPGTPGDCLGLQTLTFPAVWSDPCGSVNYSENVTYQIRLSVQQAGVGSGSCPACITVGSGAPDLTCNCDPDPPDEEVPPDPGPGEVCVETDCCPECVPGRLCWVGTGDGCAFGLATLEYFASIDAWHGTYTATGGGTISVRVWCDDASNTWKANLHCGGELIGTYAYNTTLSTCDPLSLVFDGNLAGGNGCCPTPVVGARGTVTPGECGGGPGPDECEGLPNTLYMIPQYNDDVGGCPGPVNCEGGSDDGFPFPLTKQGSDAGCCVWISEDFFQSSDTWYFEVRRCTTDVCPGTPPRSLWRVQIKLRTGNGSILNSVSCHARWNVETCFDTVTETPGILMSYTTDCGTFTVTDTPPP